MILAPWIYKFASINLPFANHKYQVKLFNFGQGKYYYTNEYNDLTPISLEFWDAPMKTSRRNDI